MIADPTKGEPGFFFNSITPSGKLLWVNRTRKGSGSGASSMTQINSETFGGIVFEKSVANNGGFGFLSTTFGGFELKQNAPETWSVSFGSGSDRVLEQHVSYSLPRNTQTLHSNLRTVSRLRRLDFNGVEISDWSMAALQSNPGQPQTALHLFLTHPTTDSTQPARAYEWALRLAANGGVSASGIGDQNGLLPPSLKLTLNARDGTFFGRYSGAPNSVTRMILGAMTSSSENPNLRARGWVQLGTDPTKPFGVWTIEQVSSAP